MTVLDTSRKHWNTTPNRLIHTTRHRVAPTPERHAKARELRRKARQVQDSWEWDAARTLVLLCGLLGMESLRLRNMMASGRGTSSAPGLNVTLSPQHLDSGAPRAGMRRTRTSMRRRTSGTGDRAASCWTGYARRTRGTRVRTRKGKGEAPGAARNGGGEPPRAAPTPNGESPRRHTMTPATGPPGTVVESRI